MAEGVVTVEPVEHRTQLRRFREIPFVLHGADRHWRPGVRAFDSWRLDAHRHPHFDRGDAAYFLARRGGVPVGRIAAHHRRRDDPQGRFGFFDVPDDLEVATALVSAARDWLGAEGCHGLRGPTSWTDDEEFGVMVHGHGEPTCTGRPWHPSWYARTLTAAGLAAAEQRHMYRLSTDEAVGGAPAPSADEPPPHAGGYGDPALVLDGIAAVPDVSATLAGASLRSAWRVARRARSDGFDTAVCVRWRGDPAETVPGLLAAARAAGYRWLISPWAPPGVVPETTHQVFSSESEGERR